MGGFARLWTATAFSNLADGVLKVALPLIALRYTTSPSLIAGLAFALTLPWLLFALPAGAWSDRLDRRLAMIGANTVRGAVALALGALVLAGGGSIWVLYVASFVIGTTETLYDTSAQSIVPQVVGRDTLARANGRLYAAELITNLFLGPPLGGFLVILGAATALFAPAGLWLAAIGLLTLLRGSFRVPRTTRTTLRADVAEGLRYLFGHRLLRTLAIMVGIGNLAGNAAWPLFVLIAVGPTSAMGLNEAEYGLLLTSLAIGSLAGSVITERVEAAIGPGRTLTASLVLMALPLAAPALTANVWVVAAAGAIGGLGLAWWNVITVSLRQRITPDAMLGRLNSGYRLLAWGTMPVGAALGAALAPLVGVRGVFALGAVASLALLLPMAVVHRELAHAAAPAAPADPAAPSDLPDATPQTARASHATDPS